MHRYRLPGLVLVYVLALVPLAAAQGGGTAIAVSNVPVYIAPDAARTPLRVAAQGTTFTVVSEEGEWTKVQFNDPQWGPRVGYVATRALKFDRPELEPLDLSVRPSPIPAAPARPTPRDEPARAQRRPYTPPPAMPSSRSFERGWIDVNLGAAFAAEKVFTLELRRPLYGGTSVGSVTYRNPTGASFDFGGGFMFTPEIGLGVSVTGTAHQKPAEVSISVPHPFFVNSAATDTTGTDRQFQRIEGGVNIQLMGAARISDGVRVRVFGGPTYFRVQQDLVSGIAYDHRFGIFTPANDVAITNYEYVAKVEGTGWGFHVGSDVSLFFTRVAGIGGFVRYSRGTVDVTEPLTESTVSLEAGGFQAGGGLRLKF